ncbi:MAG: hypothetical protein OIF35_00925, partial [Cellvibrionaceae bacterium]|nr:hypothetical protein [Cellvibrionaceae bacterium]
MTNNAKFDAANRLLEDNDYGYKYDIRGNRTARVNKSTGVVERYGYNSLNQLVEYKKFASANSAASPSASYSYRYGPFGRRWSKLDLLSNSQDEFYWSGSSLIAEQVGAKNRRYILDGLTPLGFIEDGKVYHYLRDH